MYADLRDLEFFALLNGSHARLLGVPLTERDAAWLYGEAPFVVLAHDTSADPRFTYANRAAQACFGYGLEEFLALPSRLSADGSQQETRRAVFERVARDGFVTGYSGVRVAKSGRRLRIENATIWRLIDGQGVLHGEAAAFGRWTDL
jgi:hypothetical protein